MSKTYIKGYRKFQKEVFPGKKALFQDLAAGQKPHTLFITCSDSRIVPDTILQTEPGELFIIRNAGNMIPPYGGMVGGVSATICNPRWAYSRAMAVFRPPASNWP